MLSLVSCLALLDSEQDEIEFAAFFEHYHRLVIHKAKTIVGSHESAEDVAQEVLIYVAENFQKFKTYSKRKQKNYLMACTESRAIDYLRKHHKAEYVEMEESDLSSTEQNDTERIVMTSETLAFALQCVEQLPPGYRGPLKLRMNDFSYDDIAQMLGISKDAAYKRVQRGYSMVRERLVKEYEQ